MASADVLLPPSTFGNTKRKRSSTEESSNLFNMAPTIPRKITFDPSKHLKFKAPEKIWSMEEIGLADKGVSPVAVSEPFSLFTEEAIQQMRAEILSKPVFENCKYKSNIAQFQLRGFAPE